MSGKEFYAADLYHSSGLNNGHLVWIHNVYYAYIKMLDLLGGVI